MARRASQKKPKRPRSHNPYDQSAKLLFVAALGDQGKVVPQHEVFAQARWIDVSFEPQPTDSRPPGILRRFALEPCVIEAFQGKLSIVSAHTCLAKRHQFHHQQGGSGHLPWLWILVPGHPRRVMRDLALLPARRWPRGVYENRGLRLRLAVLRELPRTRHTLLLRLLGNLDTLSLALEDLARLPSGCWERRRTLDVVNMLRSIQPSSPKEKAIVMKAESFYQKVCRENLEKGKRQGHQQGLREGQRQGRRQGLHEGRQQGLHEGHEQGLHEGHLDTLALLVETRTGKPLGATRRKRLAQRIEELGLPRVTDLLANLPPKEVAAWLTGRGRLVKRTTEEQR